jgi:UDP-N-acetyl-D-mannosaminuronic acid dehydrogenase
MLFSKVCVIGLGYIGLPYASMFATHGLQVTGVDINSDVVTILKNGGVHISEPGLQQLVQAAIQSGRLKVSNTPEEADAFIIAVPTPFYQHEQRNFDGKTYRLADMRAVSEATESIVTHLRPGNLVVLESTSPPRTTVDLVKPILEGSGLKAGVDFYLAYSPERVLPGKILEELTENEHVIGGIDEASAQAGKELYSCFIKGEIVLTDSTTAEMVKLMENTYRDINIAIAMEFCRLAERFGVDIWEAIRIANRHPRVKILNPGPGVGGHCISVDPWFLVEAAPDLSTLIAAARQVNDEQPGHVLNLIKQVIGPDLKGKHLAVLGLSFKADVDDLRESPAIKVAELLAHSGAIVRAYEPYKLETVLPGIMIQTSLDEAIADAEVLVLLVGHQVFRGIDPAGLSQLTPARLVIDTVNAWDAQVWREAGFDLRKLGVGKDLFKRDLG